MEENGDKKEVDDDEDGLKLKYLKKRKKKF